MRFGDLHNEHCSACALLMIYLIFVRFDAAVRWKYSVRTSRTCFPTFLSIGFSENLTIVVKKVENHDFFENSCQCIIEGNTTFFS